MNAQIYWVGLSVVPAARNPQAQAELICGPYCHRDQAQSQADAMTSQDLAFELFVQNISVMPSPRYQAG